jgi:hypothetical protein
MTQACIESKYCRHQSLNKARKHSAAWCILDLKCLQRHWKRRPTILKKLREINLWECLLVFLRKVFDDEEIKGEEMGRGEEKRLQSVCVENLWQEATSGTGVKWKNYSEICIKYLYGKCGLYLSGSRQ